MLPGTDRRPGAASRATAGGETLVGLYAADDPGGFGPALQVVTDHADMLMDSITVLLHRLGIAYVSMMHPTLKVRRDTDGTLLDVSTDGAAPGSIDETGSTSSCPDQSASGPLPKPWTCYRKSWPTPARSMKTPRS